MRILPAALALLAGCTYGIKDEPLARWTPAVNQPWVAQIPDGRSDELFVFLAFSGGGTRAASFAYGVLQELAATEIAVEGSRRRLLDEVDVISSVSGGSFTAAYYGLFGDRIFTEFEPRFLREDVEGALITRLLLWPPNWIRLASPTYGRSDLAADYYDAELFDGATFRGMLRPGAPFVTINATDLATGSRFGFTQLYFDYLCADLQEYPVSRAVAASSAVPVLLSPITLRNFTPACGYPAPPWLVEAAESEDPRRRTEARDLLSYGDFEKRKYIHLVDGGIADNVGLRAAFQLVSLQADTRQTFEYVGHPKPRSILFILVNAESHHDPTFTEEAASPTLGELIDAVTSDQIGHYNFETIELVSTAFRGWAAQLSSQAEPVEFEFVEVSFDAVRDESQRHALNQIGTNFSLDDEEVDLLIGAGRSLLRSSPGYQELVRAWGGTVVEAAGGAGATGAATP
ncbi:MAG: patatin-like phospholipase family protein [Thermodesulfobacteriota bacterium]